MVGAAILFASVMGPGSDADKEKTIRRRLAGRYLYLE
jgi:hypothetical protein